VELPILAFEGNDLIVFATAASAEGFVEPPDADVRDTYDATGRIMRFKHNGRVTSLVETDEFRPDDLRAALLEVFAVTRVAVNNQAPLDELVAVATRHFEYSHPTVADTARAMWKRLRRPTN
jgi:hypothetical protein